MKERIKESRKEFTICRVCHANCSLIVELEDDRIVNVVGDKNNPVSKGFSCIKGRTMGAYHDYPARLKQPQKKIGDGFISIGLNQAIGEISEKLNAIISEYGSRSVASYCGTYGFENIYTVQFLQYFMDAIGSNMRFTSATIDQPGKMIANALIGPWIPGWIRDPEEVDAAILIGNNPVVAIGGAFGLAPAYHIKKAKKRGLKLIVVDPRRSETAKYADVFMQARPGMDMEILASLIHIILKESLYDAAFVEQETRGLPELQEAVAQFTPDYVAHRANISTADLYAAARFYAAAKKGMVVCGTGPNMSPAGILTEYLGRVLTTLCGHWPRAGEIIKNPGVLMHQRGSVFAASIGPQPGWGFGEKLRVHGLSDTAAGLPSPALADEILTPGEGKIRALIVVGGNPMLAIPDQQKMERALKDLDLLICIDPVMSATARLSDYVISPTLPLEVPAVSSYNEWVGTWGLIWGYDIPYAQYTPAILSKPEGVELIDDWDFFFRLTREMGKNIKFGPLCYTNPDEMRENSFSLDMSVDYQIEDIMEFNFCQSPVPLSNIKENAKTGHVYDLQPLVIQPKPEGWKERFELANREMLEELGARLNQEFNSTTNSELLLICRRLRDHYNSNWHEVEALRRKDDTSYAYMNPSDMEKLAISEGNMVEISSDTSEIYTIVRSDEDVLKGCVSMAHGWGVNPGEHQSFGGGACTSKLVSTDRDCDPRNWMARQSAIPITLKKVDTETASVGPEFAANSL
jgi:anaerobic selenocysteine-containing dehydrogenase